MDTKRVPFVFEIPEENYPRLVEKFDKMTRRARKCKLPPPKFEVIWETEERITRRVPDRVFDPTGILGEYTQEERIIHFYYVSVSGERPMIDGWNFVATVDHTEGGDDSGPINVIRAVPGTGQIPIEYRSALPICQHCNTARRRNETFVLQNQYDPTYYKQVGRNCLQDYFEGKSPEDVATLLEWWTEAVEMATGAEDENFFGLGGRGWTRLDIESALHVTQAMIEEHGWLSRSKAREMYGVFPTADRVIDYFDPPLVPSESEIKYRAAIEQRLDDNKEHYKTLVEQALEWVRSLSPTESEDYLYNLWAVCRGESVRKDRLGLVCSLLPAYRRHIEGERKKTEAAERPSSEYVGEEGKRGTFLNCVLRYIGEPYANDWGTSTYMLFLKDGKDAIVWYMSGTAGSEWKIGEAYNLTGTVKRHEVKADKYGNQSKRTVLSRARLATDKEVNPPAKRQRKPKD